MSEQPPIRVPLVDLKAQYQSLRREVFAAIEEVLERQAFILGPAVSRFEAQAAGYLGCRAAVGVASGSDALLLSLMALDIGPGCGVVVPPFTFFASASAIVRVGAAPIFVDIDPETCLLSPAAVNALVDGCERQGGGLSHRRTGARLKALLPVHLFGQTCDMRSLQALARSHGLFIIEDVAQAMGARAVSGDGATRAAGTLGDLGCFSFFPSKTLGGIGDGGLIATHRQDLAEKLRALRMHGETARYRHELVGVNSRLDAIQAAVLAVKLRHLDQWCARRIERARYYGELFGASGLLGNGIIGIPAEGENRRHVFNYYTVRVERRDRLGEYLRGRGIQTAVYYPVPLHLQPCFKDLGYRRGEFPNAERVAGEVLALPMYPELRPEQQQYVVDTIKGFFRS
ncbi:MAG TPA: DegT/DnrJ/EryC1/StrS family aminotransferase [Candidatus Acidoferrales bacterium]|nr:DegT/DnrJ/EryC1/StrS family aminotransferase [Candidatus Acidoferrales bacterium]